jgi:hypothetical protein
MKFPINKTLLTGASVAALGLAVALSPYHALAANDGCAKINQAQGAPQSLINQTQQAQGAPQDLINKTQVAQGAPQNIINQAAGGGGGVPQNVLNQAAGGGGGVPQNVLNQAAGGGGGAPQSVLNTASAEAPRDGQMQVTENVGAQNPADCK